MRGLTVSSSFDADLLEFWERATFSLSSSALLTLLPVPEKAPKPRLLGLVATEAATAEKALPGLATPRADGNPGVESSLLSRQWLLPRLLVSPAALRTGLPLLGLFRRGLVEPQAQAPRVPGAGGSAPALDLLKTGV